MTKGFEQFPRITSTSIYNWWLYMVINIISVQYNGGFLPDIILLTQGYLHRDIRFKYHEEVMFL